MNNELNDIIKRQVDTYESEVDPQEIWEGILNKQKPKRRFLFFWLPFVCVAVIGLSFLAWNSDSSNIQISEVISREGADVNQKDESNNELDRYSEVTDEESTSKAEILVNQNNDLNQRTTRKAKTISQVSGLSLIALAANPKTNNEITTSRIIPQFISGDENIHNSVKRPTLGSSQKPNTKNTDQLLASKPKGILNILDVVPKISLIRTNLNYVHEPLAFASEWSTAPQVHPSRQENSVSIKAMFYGGIANSSPSAGNRMEAYTANILLEKRIFRSFSLSAGLSMDKLYEKFEWEGNYIVNGEEEEIGLAAEDDQGNAVVNFSSAQYDEEYYEIVERKINKYNRYEIVDIPVVISYALNFRKLRTSISAGTAFNLNSSLELTSLDELGIPREAGEDYKVGSKLLLCLDFNYPITRRLSITGGVNYSNRNLTLRASKNSIESYQAGLGLGIRL